MRTGRLTTRVAIRTAVDANTAGSITTTYPSTGARGTRWALREPLSAGERFTSQQLDAEVDHKFTFHADAVTNAIQTRDRLLVGSSSSGDWYDVVGAFTPAYPDNDARVVLATERHA